MYHQMIHQLVITDDGLLTLYKIIFLILKSIISTTPKISEENSDDNVDLNETLIM